MPTALTYHNRRLRGDAITRNSVETLFRTGFPGDAEPLPALVRMYSDPTSAGVAQRAYNYVLGDRQTTDSIMARPRPRLCRMLSTWVLTGASTASRASAPAPSA
ncbi:MAG: hypothetical protein IPM83_09560 [Ignavibacteria bacterium]|nr:hypothetical protein [Ignavibacteria bacterium]